MGEFVISEVIQSCTEASHAKAVAAGWRGDRLIIGMTAMQHYAFAWTIVLESEDRAEDFAQVLSNRDCIAAYSNSFERQTIAWHRSGRTIAITRGLDEAIAKPLRAQMLSMNAKVAAPAAPQADAISH